MRSSTVTRPSAIAMALALLFIVGAAAQAGPESRPFIIVLPGGIPSEKVTINYVLYGSFGAQGGFTTPKADSPSYQIPTSVNGKAADHLKAVVWAPGCKMATFDAPLRDSGNVQEYFSCNPLGTITLDGRLDKALLRTKPAEVRVDYLASWECTFFGFSDCMVPQFELGTVRPDADGAFEIELPDFSSDPIASRGAQLQLVLREVKTWNAIAFLEPQTESLREIGSLRILSSYPHNLLFSARKTN